jgi:hypothetical protein
LPQRSSVNSRRGTKNLQAFYFLCPSNIR